MKRAAKKPFALSALTSKGERLVSEHWTAKSARHEAKRLAGSQAIVSIHMTDSAARQTVNLLEG